MEAMSSGPLKKLLQELERGRSMASLASFVQEALQEVEGQPLIRAGCSKVYVQSVLKA